MSSVPLPGEGVGGKRASAVRAMFDRIAPRYDLLNRVMTLQVDQAWRRRLLRELAPRDGETLLDLCAGTMDVADLARRRVTGLRVVGADFSFQMLRRGVEKTGLPASQADAMALPFLPTSFDLATVTFGMRNLERYEVGLGELARVLRPGGRLGVLEFFRPESAGPRLVHGLYNRLALPVLGRVLSPDPEAYRYLVESMERFASRGEFEAAARRAGFSEVRGETLFPGVCGLVTAVRVKLVVAVSGASGAPYAKRLLDFLAEHGPAQGVSVDVVFTTTGKQVWTQELGAPPRLPFPSWSNHDFTAPFASGSAAYDAMVVIPCSAGQLSRIAYGLSVDLVGRAADVMLKERRRLVLVLRETPISLVHARAITQVVEAGAVVMPASPSFYSQPRSIDALVDTVVARVLDRLGLPNDLMTRWTGLSPRAPEPVEEP